MLPAFPCVMRRPADCSPFAREKEVFMPESYLPPILPCSTCGGREQKLESCQPAGRRHELWRVVCPCGCALTQWAVSQGSAIRLWNRFLGEDHKD